MTEEDEATRRSAIKTLDGWLRKYVSVYRTWQTARQIRREDLPYHWNEADPKENLETSPPPSESIDVNCIWVAEVYPPSLTESLGEATRRLGWDETDVSAFHPYDSVLRWIGSARGSAFGGGWMNLGLIDRPRAQPRFLPDARKAPLPAGVDFAYGGIHGITSGLTVVVLGFVFEDEFAAKLNAPLSKRYKTYVKRRANRYWSFITPEHQKREAVSAAREELARVASQWMKDHMPGAFASGLLDGEFPSLEFITTKEARPFHPSEPLKIHSYESILNFEHDFDAYQSSSLVGLRLGRLGRASEERPFAHTLAGCWDEIAGDEDFKSYGGKDRHGLVSYLHHRIEPNLVLWAMEALLVGYQRQLARSRDRARTWKPLRAGRTVKELATAREQVSRRGPDAETAAAEIRELAEVAEGKAFRRYATDFEPVHESRKEFWGGSLLEEVRQGCLNLSNRLEVAERQLRSSLRADAELMAAITNVRLQRTVIGLTAIVVVLTAVLIYLTVILLGGAGS